MTTTPLKRAAGHTAAAGLAGAAALHALWASGSTWPERDYDDLANLVVGRAAFPSRPLTAGVAGLLLTASAVAAAASGPTPSQSWVVRMGARTVAAILLTRGVGGLAASTLAVGNASDTFRRWDRRLYSPLCLVLAAGVAAGSRR